MIDAIVFALESVALVIGFTIMGFFALVYVGGTIAEHTRLGPSTDLDDPPESLIGRMVVESLEGAIEDELGDGCELEHVESPIAQIDWSYDCADLSPEYIKDVLAAIDLAGLHAHPFPQTPDRIGGDGWEWSTKYVGVWADEPTWYIEGEDGDRVEVTPDLSHWEPVAESTDPSEWEDP